MWSMVSFVFKKCFSRKIGLTCIRNVYYFYKQTSMLENFILQFTSGKNWLVLNFVDILYRFFRTVKSICNYEVVVKIAKLSST